MAYPQSINFIRPASAKTCMVYSTKDRAVLTNQTFPALAAEGDFDLIWMDGSKTEEGRELPAILGPSAKQLTEIHHGVTGGPDAAIVYGLSYALKAGYTHIGLIENDVLLEQGWFKALLDLFTLGAKDDLKVGAVTARPYDRRTLWQTAEYSVHFGSGAGMIMFSREAAKIILQSYRTTTHTEIQDAFRTTGAPEFSKWSETARIDLTQQNLNATSADWYFDSVLIKNGMVVLGTVPGFAENIDADMHAFLGVSVTKSPERNDANLPAFKSWKSSLAQKSQVQETVYTYDSFLGLWIVYTHQIAARFPSAISGAWSCKWRQTCGPFTLITEGSDAKISLPVDGNVKVVLGPETKWPRRLARFGLPTRSVFQGRWPVVSGSQEAHTHSQFLFENAKIGTEFVALAFDRVQEWMHEPPDFRFEHIEPFLTYSNKPS